MLADFVDLAAKTAWLTSGQRSDQTRLLKMRINCCDWLKIAVKQTATHANSCKRESRAAPNCFVCLCERSPASREQEKKANVVGPTTICVFDVYLILYSASPRNTYLCVARSRRGGSGRDQGAHVLSQTSNAQPTHDYCQKAVQYNDNIICPLLLLLCVRNLSCGFDLHTARQTAMSDQPSLRSASTADRDGEGGFIYPTDLPPPPVQRTVPQERGESPAPQADADCLRCSRSGRTSVGERLNIHAAQQAAICW